MNKQSTRPRGLAAGLCLAAALGMTGLVGIAGMVGIQESRAETLDELLGVRSATTVAGAQSQAKIDQIVNDTASLLAQYKRILKHVESLKIYNDQQRRRIRNQELELQDLDAAIAQATTIRRRITPLIEQMVDSLSQFVELDMPFLLKERRDRVAFLKEMIGIPEISPTEQFNQVFQAYQIENTYGTTIEAYTDIIDIDGAPRQVDVLKWGRVALLFQTPDGDITGAWDQELGEWVILSSSYRRAVRAGLRMANKTQTADLVRLPVPPPVAAAPAPAEQTATEQAAEEAAQ